MSFKKWLRRIFNRPKPVYDWPDDVLDLEKWLIGNKKIRSKILWNASKYSSWSFELKKKLFDYYTKLYRDESLSIADPPPNQFEAKDGAMVAQSLSREDAQNLYLSYVANSLVLEIKKKVPWSLNGLDTNGLRIVLDSRQMFSRLLGKYYIVSIISGRAVPAPSDYTWNFMSDKIGNSRKETIENLLTWCKGMSHYGYAFEGKNVEDYWQYRGFPPVSRIIEKTTHPRFGTSRHYTAGCHGTVGFLRAVLRAVNIPVEYRSTNLACSHAHPYFVSEDLYLSHGDDPYSRHFINSLKPSSYLLITGELFKKWFRTGSSRYRCKNVGRRVKELTGEFSR